MEADKDFQQLQQYPTNSTEIIDIPANSAYLGNSCPSANIAEYPDDNPEIIDGIPERTPSELRAIQRAMLALSLDDSVKASERAQCARAYRDIEIVRRAIRGKPLVMNPSMRVDAKPARSPSPLVLIDMDDDKRKSA